LLKHILNNMNSNDWIGLQEASKYLKMNPGSILNARCAGKESPPFYKVGGKLLTKKSILDEWIISK
jgi:hypothetical protein